MANPTLRPFRTAQGINETGVDNPGILDGTADSAAAPAAVPVVRDSVSLGGAAGVGSVDSRAISATTSPSIFSARRTLTAEDDLTARALAQVERRYSTWARRGADGDRSIPLIAFSTQPSVEQVNGTNRPYIEIVRVSSEQSNDRGARVFDAFILTALNMQDAEKTEVVETFGSPHVFSSGRFVKKLMINGFVRSAARNPQGTGRAGFDSQDTARVPDAVLFRNLYDDNLRSSKMAKQGTIANLYVDGDVFEGFFTSLNISRDSQMEQMSSFSMSMLVLRHSHVGDPGARLALQPVVSGLEDEGTRIPAELLATELQHSIGGLELSLIQNQSDAVQVDADGKIENRNERLGIDAGTISPSDTTTRFETGQVRDSAALYGVGEKLRLQVIDKDNVRGFTLVWSETNAHAKAGDEIHGKAIPAVNAPLPFTIKVRSYANLFDHAVKQTQARDGETPQNGDGTGGTENLKTVSVSRAGQEEPGYEGQSSFIIVSDSGSRVTAVVSYGVTATPRVYIKRVEVKVGDTDSVGLELTPTGEFAADSEGLLKIAQNARTKAFLAGVNDEAELILNWTIDLASEDTQGPVPLSTSNFDASRIPFDLFAAVPVYRNDGIPGEAGKTVPSPAVGTTGPGAVKPNSDDREAFDRYLFAEGSPGVAYTAVRPSLDLSKIDQGRIAFSSRIKVANQTNAGDDLKFADWAEKSPLKICDRFLIESRFKVATGSAQQSGGVALRESVPIPKLRIAVAMGDPTDTHNIIRQIGLAASLNASINRTTVDGFPYAVRVHFQYTLREALPGLEDAASGEPLYRALPDWLLAQLTGTTVAVMAGSQQFDLRAAHGEVRQFGNNRGLLYSGGAVNLPVSPISGSRRQEEIARSSRAQVGIFQDFSNLRYFADAGSETGAAQLRVTFRLILGYQADQDPEAGWTSIRSSRQLRALKPPTATDKSTATDTLVSRLLTSAAGEVTAAPYPIRLKPFVPRAPAAPAARTGRRR